MKQLIPFCLVLPLLFDSSVSFAQEQAETAEDIAAAVTGEQDTKADEVEVAAKVEVDRQTSDEKITSRLSEIYEATGWFESLEIDVNQGVVVLKGKTNTVKHREWAESTAMRTTDVVAVVNQLQVPEQPFFNLLPAWESLKQLGRETISMLPLLLVAIIISFASYYAARIGAVIVRHVSKKRMTNSLLQQLVSTAVAVTIFIIGFYIALRVSGLTRLAVTLLGGTGLVGLALGFAFRDIAENYLASILLSLNHPFRVGDLIEVDGAKGYVRKVTTRGTILNTLEGNQIQIPNSTVYKNQILNYTATPLLRLEFSVGIGFDDSVSEAQLVIMNVFENHEAIKTDPAPLVLVDSLGAATVNLKCLYWIDQHEHSGLKVGSSVIRLTKEALTDRGISMPDEARELVFPQGVPVTLMDRSIKREVNDSAAGVQTETSSNGSRKSQTTSPRESTVSTGEGDLSSERNEVMRVTSDDEVTADETNLIA